MASGPRGTEAFLVLMLMAAVATIGLWLAVRLARRAQRPRSKKPPRRSFEHGGRLGRERRVATLAAALAALQGAPVGELRARDVRDRRVDVVLKRKRSQPCEQAVGYLSALFESAWAHEVLVTHPVCAGPKGGECAYTVQRAPTRPAARTGPASTPGSEVERRRSPRARPGAG